VCAPENEAKAKATAKGHGFKNRNKVIIEITID